MTKDTSRKENKSGALRGRRPQNGSDSADTSSDELGALPPLYDRTEEDARGYAATMKKLIRWDYRPWAERVAASAAGRYRVARVGDIACGPGYFALEVARLLGPCRVTFTDSSETMLRIAAEGAEAAGVEHATVACEAEELNLEGDCLDVALCKQFFHEARDWKACLEELFRVLAPRGRAYLIDFDAEGSALAARAIKLWIRASGGREMADKFWTSFTHGLPRTAVLREARAVGFKRVQVVSRGPNYYIVVQKPR